ncbi:hypothetical protein M422DRAFT_254117 [Sphaerobolus stellatus SS14]|uniref:Uncharacterized protein n=1 Tax=Sphaerobolus stellatus (strain SS14) TaxID=990650 RepID=A0A0C9VWH3_SPHS4|nr:hypothetical protein M422DRAFT_254117 [Sphaerobolus stellatus SS14]
MAHISQRLECCRVLEAHSRTSEFSVDAKHKDLTIPQDHLEDPPEDWYMEPNEAEHQILQNAAQNMGQLFPSYPTSEPNDNVEDQPHKQVHIEEIIEEESYRVPHSEPAGVPLGPGETRYDHLKCLQQGGRLDSFGPFANQEECELAQWLINSGVSQNEIDHFLKLDSTHNCTQPSYKDKRTLLDKIDGLPMGLGWKCYSFTVQGDLMDYNGECLTEELDIWC